VDDERTGADRFDRLNELVEGMDHRDLLIVDEAHAASNRNNLNSCLSHLRGLLDARPPERRPRLLLMTATPYGTGVHNLNALLRLLRVDKTLHAGREAEIASVDAVVNATLPWIMQRFGRIMTDAHTGRTGHALDFPRADGSMTTAFFPEMRCRIVTYDDGMRSLYPALEINISPGYTAFTQARRRCRALCEGGDADPERLQRALEGFEAARDKWRTLTQDLSHSMLQLFTYIRMAGSSWAAIDHAMQKRDKSMGGGKGQRINLSGVTIKNKDAVKKKQGGGHHLGPGRAGRWEEQNMVYAYIESKLRRTRGVLRQQSSSRGVCRSHGSCGRSFQQRIDHRWSCCSQESDTAAEKRAG
jgi:hypothetical protein